MLRELELDDYNDKQRIALFKHTIKEVNRMLTRARNNLSKCEDIDAAIEYLGTQMKGNIDSIEDLMYQSYKQAWIRQAVNELEQLKTIEDIMEIISEEDSDD